MENFIGQIDTLAELETMIAELTEENFEEFSSKLGEPYEEEREDYEVLGQMPELAKKLLVAGMLAAKHEDESMAELTNLLAENDPRLQEDDFVEEFHDTLVRWDNIATTAKFLANQCMRGFGDDSCMKPIVGNGYVMWGRKKPCAFTANIQSQAAKGMGKTMAKIQAVLAEVAEKLQEEGDLNIAARIVGPNGQIKPLPLPNKQALKTKKQEKDKDFLNFMNKLVDEMGADESEDTVQ